MLLRWWEIFENEFPSQWLYFAFPLVCWELRCQRWAYSPEYFDGILLVVQNCHRVTTFLDYFWKPGNVREFD